VAIALLREESAYGYALMKRLAEFGFEAINSGTLYRTLRRMEVEGLCQSTWDTSNGRGPACRVYSATPAGEAHLDSWAEGLNKYGQVLDSFFLAHACR
jgi:poly-beta-hydroxybutyrate-responsive repressor